jgi:hypothetical protein
MYERKRDEVTEEWKKKTILRYEDVYNLLGRLNQEDLYGPE